LILKKEKINQRSTLTLEGKMEKQFKQFLRIKEAAEKLGVSPSTLRRWVDKKIIKAVRSYQNAHRRFPLSEIQRLLSQ
jgi:excisionase family DNA binding protein